MEQEKSLFCLQAAAQGIAEHLDGWEYKPVSDWAKSWDEPDRAAKTHAHLHRPDDGAEISIHANGYQNEGRLSISGCYPNGYCMPYGKTQPEISVTQKKSGKQIAADIDRRLLPRYLPQYAKAVESDRASKAYHAKREAVAAEFAEIFGATFNEYQREKDAFSRYGHDRQISVDFGGWYDGCGYDSVKLGFDAVPLDLARKLARIVADHNASVAAAG